MSGLAEVNAQHDSLILTSHRESRIICVCDLCLCRSSWLSAAFVRTRSLPFDGQHIMRAVIAGSIRRHLRKIQIDVREIASHPICQLGRPPAKTNLVIIMCEVHGSAFLMRCAFRHRWKITLCWPFCHLEWFQSLFRHNEWKTISKLSPCL